jgi:hypothetical protein
MRTPDGWVSSYGTEVLKVLAGADTYIIRTNDNGVEEVRVKGLPPVKTDSLGRKWISWVVPRETSLAEMDVENKFVFVGFTAKGIMPQTRHTSWFTRTTQDTSSSCRIYTNTR